MGGHRRWVRAFLGAGWPRSCTWMLIMYMGGAAGWHASRLGAARCRRRWLSNPATWPGLSNPATWLAPAPAWLFAAAAVFVAAPASPLRPLRHRRSCCCGFCLPASLPPCRCSAVALALAGSACTFQCSIRKHLSAHARLVCSIGQGPHAAWVTRASDTTAAPLIHRASACECGWVRRCTRHARWAHHGLLLLSRLPAAA